MTTFNTARADKRQFVRRFNYAFTFNLVSFDLEKSVPYHTNVFISLLLDFSYLKTAQSPPRLVNYGVNIYVVPIES